MRCTTYCTSRPTSCMIVGFREYSLLLLRYHPSWRRVRPGVRPRGAAGYAGRDMGLSEARKPVVGCVTN